MCSRLESFNDTMALALYSIFLSDDFTLQLYFYSKEILCALTLYRRAILLYQNEGNKLLRIKNYIPLDLY